MKLPDDVKELAINFCPYRDETLKSLWMFGFEDCCDGKPAHDYAPYHEAIALHHGWYTANVFRSEIARMKEDENSSYRT